MEVAALHALKQRIRANALNTIPLAMMTAYAFPTIATLALAATWYGQKMYFGAYMENVIEKAKQQKTDAPAAEEINNQVETTSNSDKLEMRLLTAERIRLSAFLVLSAGSTFSIYKHFVSKGNMLPAVIKSA